MFTNPSTPTSMIFPLVMGCLLILLTVFNKPLLRFLKITPRSEAFTIPKFQRSAETIETLGRLSTAILGIGFILYAVGGVFLPLEVQYTLVFALGGVLGLIVLAMAGVTFANWRA